MFLQGLFNGGDFFFPADRGSFILVIAVFPLSFSDSFSRIGGLFAEHFLPGLIIF